MISSVIGSIRSVTPYQKLDRDLTIPPVEVFPADIQKDIGVTIFPKPILDIPDVDSIPATERENNVIIENPPYIPKSIIDIFPEDVNQGETIIQFDGGFGEVNLKKALETAQGSHKGGETLAGHALQKHAGQNPDIWGKVKGSAEQINQQAIIHIDDIINGPGEFEIFTTDRGAQFWEKRLSDGRGLRLNLDGTFKGFIDQIR